MTGKKLVRKKKGSGGRGIIRPKAALNPPGKVRRRKGSSVFDVPGSGTKNKELLRTNA